jgi:hypothetical protein
MILMFRNVRSLFGLLLPPPPPPLQELMRYIRKPPHIQAATYIQLRNGICQTCTAIRLLDFEVNNRQRA